MVGNAMKRAQRGADRLLCWRKSSRSASASKAEHSVLVHQTCAHVMLLLLQSNLTEADRILTAAAAVASCQKLIA
jgi:hypothetical protein